MMLGVNESLDTLLPKMVRLELFQDLGDGYDLSDRFREFALNYVDKIKNDGRSKNMTDADAFNEIIFSFLGMVELQDLNNFTNVMLGRNQIIANKGEGTST